MLKNEKIDIRIRALKYNLDQINGAYRETTRDVVIDTGMEYGKKYLYNTETLDIIKKQDELRKSREDQLFFAIFNFTQVYNSIKEYLKKEYPVKKKEIEEFYCVRHLGFKARKDISNDLKHNPLNDLKYRFKLEGKETIEGKNIVVNQSGLGFIMNLTQLNIVIIFMKNLLYSFIKNFYAVHHVNK